MVGYCRNRASSSESREGGREEGIHTYRHVCLALAERSACSGVEAWAAAASMVAKLDEFRRSARSAGKLGERGVLRREVSTARGGQRGGGGRKGVAGDDSRELVPD